MFNTLYGKLAAVLLGLFCIVGIIYLLVTLSTTRMFFEEANQKLNYSLAENLVSQKILMTDGRVNETVLEELFHELMVINPGIEVYLLDPGGNILAFSAPPGKVKRRKVSLDPVNRFLHDERRFPILGDDPRDPNRKKIFSAAPIVLNKGGDKLLREGVSIDGYLYIILGGEEYDSVAEMLEGSYILRLSIWAVAGGLVFTLVTGLVTFNLLTRRLTRLSAAMEDFKRADFNKRSDTISRFEGRPVGDEIDSLWTAFNRMADRIIEQVQSLRQTDKSRRELVASVSHDLRTPLAALQGYLETLLMKPEQLTGEQKNYLEIASNHTNRLSKLVDELFELAKLDSRDTEPHFEPFSIGELVQDVVQKFQLPAEKRKVRLKTDFSEDIPFVFADIGLIERVLENLIENAMRFTRENGFVTITLSREGEKVMVRVTDTGCGISKEELPRVFDRFYRVDKSRGGDNTGSGLGLAIAKSIVELHGSPIKAESTKNIGSIFSFSLPVYHP
jgi:signal transduction histidine kinase